MDDLELVQKVGALVPPPRSHLVTYHGVLENMLKNAVRHGVEVGVCGSCMDARGITADRLVEGTRRSSLDEWAQWTIEAEKVGGVLTPEPPQGRRDTAR